jgi:hypothetical protein
MSKLTDDIREWASQPWIGPVLEEAMQAWAREVAELERAAALVAGPEARFGEATYGKDAWTVYSTSYRGDLPFIEALACFTKAKQGRRPSRLVLELDRYDPSEPPADPEVPA